jgi:hypothetical protein
MIVFFWRNITPERSCRTGEAERVRWVYEWGRGFESGAKDATVLFFCEDGSTPISHHLAVDPYLSYDRITITGLPPPYPRYAIDFHMPALKVCQPCVPWGRLGGAHCEVPCVRCIGHSRGGERRKPFTSVIANEMHTPFWSSTIALRRVVT